MSRARRDFVPVPDEVVKAMGLDDAKIHLDRIKAVLVEIQEERRAFIAGNVDRIKSKGYSRRVLELNLERAKYSRMYQVVQDRLSELKSERRRDADREADNWLHLFHREAKKEMDQSVYQRIVGMVSDIVPMPSRIKNIT